MFGRLTDEQQALAGDVFDLGKRLFAKDDVARWREEHGLPSDTSSHISDFVMGRTSLFDPDIQACQFLEATLITEQLTHAAGAALPVATDLTGMLCLKLIGKKRPILDYCDHYAKKGCFLFALCSTEQTGGSDTKRIETIVRRTDGKPYLNGRKSFVNNGEFCPFLLVSAIDQDALEQGLKRPLSLWLIPNGVSGVEAIPIKKSGQGILPFADISFSNVALEEENNLMKAADGSSSKLVDIFDVDRLLVCASCLGMAQAAMDDAAERALERNAFGQSIAQFQLVQEMILRMQIKIENMRNLVYAAAFEFDNGGDYHVEIAKAKWYVPRAAVEVASDAIQIFGAAGYTEQERVYGIWEDCRGNQIASGTDQIMVAIAAPRILSKYKK